MRTNIDIDEALLAEAMEACGAKTKREAVLEALRRMVAIKRQAPMQDLWGIGWEGDLDEMRTSKHIS